MKCHDYEYTKELSFGTMAVFRMRDLPNGQVLELTDLPQLVFRVINTHLETRSWWGVRVLPHTTMTAPPDQLLRELKTELRALVTQAGNYHAFANNVSDMVGKLLRSVKGGPRSAIFALDGQSERIRITGANGVTLRGGDWSDDNLIDEYYHGRGCYVGYVTLEGVTCHAIVHHPFLDITDFVSPDKLQTHFQALLKEGFPQYQTESLYNFEIVRKQPRKGKLPVDDLKIQ